MIYRCPNCKEHIIPIRYRKKFVKMCKITGAKNDVNDYPEKCNCGFLHNDTEMLSLYNCTTIPSHFYGDAIGFDLLASNSKKENGDKNE